MLRPATPEDSTGIHAVHIASIRGIASVDYPPEQVEAWIGGREPIDYRNAIQRGNERMYVALREDGTISGFSSLARDEIRALYVDPRDSRKGLGTALLQAAEQAALAVGFKEVHLSSSLTAEAFYLAQGYRAYLRTALELTGGIQLPCVRMLKNLE
jgi:putative acetyltransferase